MFVSVPLGDNAFEAGHLSVVRADCADVPAEFLFSWKKNIFESRKLTFPTSLSFFARSDGGINSCNVPPFPIDELSTVMKIEQARELHINLNSC